MPSSGTTPIRIPSNIMSVVTETNIFRSDDLAIDFFSWRDGHNQTVAITFTPFGIVGAVSLDGAGFGGELTLPFSFREASNSTRCLRFRHSLKLTSFTI